MPFDESTLVRLVDRHIHKDSRLNTEISDLLNNISGRMQIDETLVRISKRSHVLLPLPKGYLRVVMRRVFVGMRTGPFTRNSLSFAPRIRSVHTFSTLLTSQPVNLIRILCCSTSAIENPAFSMLPLLSGDYTVHFAWRRRWGGGVGHPPLLNFFTDLQLTLQPSTIPPRTHLGLPAQRR